MNPVERQRRQLRVVFFGIIVATLPFYCAGLLLWSTAPQPNRPTPTAPVVQTLPPTTVVFPTRTNPGEGATIPPTFTQVQIIQPTFQIVTQPPIILPPVLPTATPFIFPTITPAPTLTPFLTDTPLPIPTSTPAPTDTALPIPTNTPVDLVPAVTLPGG
jgi:hypothetical protein